MTIHIEIIQSPLKKGTWNIRTGDIEGSSECINFSKNKLMEEIESQLENEIELNSLHKEIAKEKKDGQQEIEAWQRIRKIANSKSFQIPIKRPPKLTTLRGNNQQSEKRK